MRALRRSSTATAAVAAADRVTVSARTPPPVFPMPSPRGTPPVNRRDRRPARNAQPGRNACIAPHERGDRHRRGRRPARNAQPGRNARIAPLERGDRHRRGRRPGHRQRPDAAAGFPTPSPRGPSAASRRDRRPARDTEPGRNVRIAQLEHGGRHRRGRRPGHRQRLNAAAGFSMPPPRGPPPANHRDRRPARNIRPERNARIAQFEHGGRHRRGPQTRHRSASHSVLDPPCSLAPSRRLPNPRTGAGFPHNHRSPRFIRFPQPTPLWKTARGRRSCDVDPSQRRSGPVDMWKTCVA